MKLGPSAILSKVKSGSTPSKAQSRLQLQAKQVAAKTAAVVPPAMPTNTAGGATTSATASSFVAVNESGDEAVLHSGNTFENYVLPSNLRMDVSNADESSVNHQGNAGLEVIKVSKVRVGHIKMTIL